jgi:two-component SAPR family response regulator
MRPAKRRFRVMIVEDEALIAMTIAHLVASYGYEVVGPFGKVSRALDSLHEEPVDAAVLDVQLDRDIVFPVAAELAARKIPFAFLTAHQAQTFPEKFKGMQRVSKPFQQSELKRTLSRLIRNRNQAGSQKT